VAILLGDTGPERRLDSSIPQWAGFCIGGMWKSDVE